MIGYTLGAMPMLMLGGYQFGVNTAAFQQLMHSSEYRWPAQEVFGSRPRMQHTGQGAESITLQGTILTEWRGGAGQLDNMRALAGRGLPLPMMTGDGRMLGRWVIEKIEETQSVFAAFGRPRKQEFNLQLRKFSDKAPGAGNAAAATSVASAAADAAKKISAGDNPVKVIGEFADKATSSIGSAVASAASAVANLRDQVASAAGPAINAVNRSIAMANDLNSKVTALKSMAGNLNSVEGFVSAMEPIMAASVISANTAAAASVTVKSTDLSGIEGSAAAKKAAAETEAAVSRVSVASVQVNSSAKELTDEDREYYAQMAEYWKNQREQNAK